MTTLIKITGTKTKTTRGAAELMERSGIIPNKKIDHEYRKHKSPNA